MALINLELIGLLYDQARSSKQLATSQCYNWDNDSDIKPELFVRLYKTYKQAENLLDKLRKLHAVCRDLATDNLQAYYEDYEQHADEETPPFDPFEEIIYHFFSDTIRDLPPTIAQYKELCMLAANYQHIRETHDAGFQQFFGDVDLHYQGTDQAGNPVFIAQSQLPEEVRNLIEINRQIKLIEVGYCLDGYDTFYLRAQAAIDLSKETNDYKGCAAYILSLYHPVDNEANAPS
ncbi:hypothetical protein WBJ53_14900 [Spirosoma sp. SC4-14]|uniref:hypothetical protein n=1 Tax=Spirosoma sp. SC4-14 TaxID=3128900 RepID=UPI0030CC4FAC